jgi:hypothetical protein
MKNRLFGMSVCAAASIVIMFAQIARAGQAGQLGTALPPAGGQAEAQGQAGQRGQGGGRGQAAGPAKPTPRAPDGKVILGTAPGEKALWFPAGGGGERFINTDDANPVAGKLKVSEVPFQPWARALYEHRGANQLEPHTRCKPSGGPRQFLTPYGVEILDMPELKQIFIMDLGGPHTYRTIYMDGRPHPKNLVPSYYGHSTGRWDGDTLVIDTAGFNEKFWIDRQGVPHTNNLHMIERLTRTDYNTIRYEVTISDPGAYTAVWTSGFNLRWTANSELFEYICQDNNFASDLMVGAQEFVDRSSQIIP